MLQDDKEKKGQTSFWRDIADSVIDDQKDALRFARIGAVLGAAVAGSVGLFYFGFFGLIAGVISGAIVGGIGLWLMHQLA